MLSCYCEWDNDHDAGDWLYDYRQIDQYEFEPLQTRRRVRCCSCNSLIAIGALCLRHGRHRYPHDEIESQIKMGMWLEDAMNDEPCIRVADHYQCERCGEIWLNLHALGYECLSPGESMEEALADYHELSGFERKTA